LNSSCSVELLESALAGELPPEREEILHHHLDECEACVAALEQMAGGEAGCREAAALLTIDELDQAAPSREEWSDVDFTVEHLEPSDEPNLLGRLGGYGVLEIIGHGGMSVVLKAHDRELNRYVAVKVLSPHLAQSSLARKRFAREAQAAAAVVHPNVMAIHQVQANGPMPFLVMPLVAGESLAQRLAAQGRLELKETLRIAMQAAAGLAAAHEQGLVHRDVKPSNILLEKGVERAVLTDFGLARAADDVSMTRWGVIVGTPQYMSPEQARGEPVDGRSDLFSLGCVLYEMATGVSPFRADSTAATLRRLIDDSPPALASLNPELPPWFIAIVERMLEKDPSRRFSSAKEVSELLENCLAHLQQPTSVPLPTALPAPAARSVSRLRNILFKGTVIMIATIGTVLLGMLLMQATEPPDIAGQWTGEGWGHVVLKPTAAGQYEGTYSDTVGKQAGKIQLKWSRIERRFNGTWAEGQDRFGELSVRLGDHEIRGALTTDLNAKINPATPRLADLLWTRVEATTSQAEVPTPLGHTASGAVGVSAPPLPLVLALGQELPTGKWVDVMNAIDTDWDTVSGIWHRGTWDPLSGIWRPQGTELTAERSPFQRIMLPVELEGSYELKVEFTRLSLNNSVDIVFPIGNRDCMSALASVGETAHALSLVNGKDTVDPDNPTARRPGTLINGHRYCELISVRLEGDKAKVDVSLDNQAIISWNGRQETLDVPPFWSLPKRHRPALAGYDSDVVFHSALVRVTAGNVRMAPPHVSPPIDLNDHGWVDLLKDVNPDRDAIQGRWLKAGNGIRVAPDSQDESFVRLMLPNRVERSYDLLAEFTRTRGSDSVTFTLPVGSRQCTLVLSAKAGLTDGLEVVDGQSISDKFNPAVRHPSVLVNGQKHQLLTRVRVRDSNGRQLGWDFVDGNLTQFHAPDGNAVIDIWLDGKPLLHWAGKPSSLDLPEEWSLPERWRVGIGANRDGVTFHTVRLRPVDAGKRPAVEAVPSAGARAE